jgi:hypothetical protein
MTSTSSAICAASCGETHQSLNNDHFAKPDKHYHPFFLETHKNRSPPSRFSKNSHKPSSLISYCTVVLNCPYPTSHCDHIIFNHASNYDRLASQGVLQHLVTAMVNIVTRRFAIPQKTSLMDQARSTCLSESPSINHLPNWPDFLLVRDSRRNTYLWLFV